MAVGNRIRVLELPLERSIMPKMQKSRCGVKAMSEKIRHFRRPPRGGYFRFRLSKIKTASQAAAAAGIAYSL